MNSEQHPFEEEKETPYSHYYGTGVPRRHQKGHGWLVVLFLVLLVATTACAVLAKFYHIELQTEGNRLSLIVDKKGTEEETVPNENTAEQAQQEEISAAEAEQHASVLGTGATLEISERDPEDPAVPAEGGELTLQAIYKKMIPSVASIIAVTDGGSASGTGIVMTADGYIITNEHVVDGGESYTVLLHDDSQYTATLVGADAVSDLAVLKIDASGLTAAEFGDSTTVEVGDTVVAIGDPLGIELRGTMTDGIISAINRDVTTNGRTLTLLQTNAQLNNGNSGGPLINIYGQVIGINTMKMGSYYTTSVEGIGFAIPISSAKPIIDELIEQGYVSGRPALGIQGDSVPAYVQAFYHLPDGVYVAYVYPDSDAAAKGLAEGDIITAIDGTEISSMDDLNTIKNQHIAGDTVRLTVYRGGQRYSVDIVLMDQNDAD